MEVTAAVARHVSAPLTIESAILSDLGEHDILIEAKAAGLCHSDLHVIQGGTSMGFPLIPGHEGAGIVRQVGSAVTDLKPGDHVITCAIGECGVCPSCRSTRTNLCDVVGLPAMALGLSPSAHFKLKDSPVHTLSPGATFASHTILNHLFAIKIPPAMPLDVACLFSCAVVTGVGCVLYTAEVEAGASAAVFGLGGVGLNVLDGLQLAGAKTIIGIDANPAKEAIGRQFGMTHFINAKKEPDIVGAIREITGGGADYAFECVGRTSLGQMAISCTRPEWGKIVQIGACPPNDNKLPVAVPEILSGRTLYGSFFGKAKPRSDIPKMIDAYMAGKLHADKLVSHRLKLGDINEGFRIMETGESIRAVIEF
jgi:S-(hydroxymethyl)glutathione dehydrogenase/alcohol dehydrogenase